MVKAILGKKLGMTQVFAENGDMIPVTVLKAGPCVVVQRKTQQSDGYDAAQLGLVEVPPPKRVNKPLAGHFKKANANPVRFLREVRLAQDGGEVKVGDKVLVDVFAVNDRVDVIGVSRAGGLRDSTSATILAAAERRTVRCSTARRDRLAPRHFLRG